MGGLASGVWGGLSGKNQKDKEAAAAKDDAEGAAEEAGEEAEEKTESKGGFF